MRKLLSFALLLLISGVIHAQVHTVTVKVQHPGLINNNLVIDSICFNYEHDEVDTLIAAPLEGYYFLKWTEENTTVSDSDTLIIDVQEDRTLYAIFKLQPPVIDPVDAICSGKPLELNTPAVINVFDTVFWQLSEHESFTQPESYVEGQPLDSGYNGWWIRFCAANPTDIVYSNAVTITVFDLDPTLTGDSIVCSNEETVYRVEGAENAVVQWEVSDSPFSGTDNPFTVNWSTSSGEKLLSLLVTDTLTGCTASLEMAVTVNDFNPTLSGLDLVCSNEEAEYYVEGADNAVVQWVISDSTYYGIGNPFTVNWSTFSGEKLLSVLVTDTMTGCTANLGMEVYVMSHVDTTEMLVERKKDGVTYLLIYPNPDTLLYKYQWYFNDSAISCDKQYLYKPVAEGGLEPGSYKVFVSFKEDENGSLICGSFSPEFVVIQPSESSRLSIFPNPSHPQEQLVVINEDMETAALYIYSADGRLMHHQLINGYQVNLNLGLPKGVYSVQLKSDQSTKTGRIVIE